MKKTGGIYKGQMKKTSIINRTVIRYIRFNRKRGKYYVWCGLFSTKTNAKKFIKDHFMPGEVELIPAHVLDNPMSHFKPDYIDFIQ